MLNTAGERSHQSDKVRVGKHSWQDKHPEKGIQPKKKKQFSAAGIFSGQQKEDRAGFSCVHFLMWIKGVSEGFNTGARILKHTQESV